MAIGYNTPKIVTDNMVICCDGTNKRTFADTALVGIGKSESWNQGNTATNYNSTFHLTYSPDLNLFAGITNTEYIVGYSGTDNKQVQTSTSGTGWVARSEAHPAQWVDICWGKDINGTGKFVACAYAMGISNESSSKKFMYSTTGTSGWTSVTVAGVSQVNFRSIGAGNSTFIAVGSNSSGDGEVWKSDYGSSGWSSKTPAADNGWYAVCWGDTGGSDGTWVAISFDGTDRLMYSTDNGDTWSNSGVSGFTDTESWRAITYGKDKFVAVAMNGAVSYSTNGINWTATDFDAGSSIENIVYGGGYYIASGGNYASGNGSISYSGDGIEWASIDRVAGVAATSYSWSKKGAFGNNRFVLMNSVMSGSYGDLFGHDHFNRVLYSDDLSTINSLFGGTTITDISTNNNDLALQTTFSKQEGLISFDGVNGYVQTLSNSDVAFGLSDFATETWVKFSNLTSIFQTLWETRSSTSSTDGFLVYSLPIGNANGNWGVYIDSALRISGGSAVIDTWYHVVVTRIGGTLTLYVDGISIGTFNDNYNYTNDDLYIGKNIADTLWHSGYIGLIRVYKGKGLSVNKVRQNFNATKGRYK